MSRTKDMEEMYQDLKNHAELEINEKIYNEAMERVNDFQTTYEGVGSPSSAMSKQIGGDHYVKHSIQPWDIIDEYGLDFYRGNAIKYILRNKMDVYEDIEKAIHYLNKWLEDSRHDRY